MKLVSNPGLLISRASTPSVTPLGLGLDEYIEYLQEHALVFLCTELFKPTAASQQLPERLFLNCSHLVLLITMHQQLSSGIKNFVGMPSLEKLYELEPLPRVGFKIIGWNRYFTELESFSDNLVEVALQVVRVVDVAPRVRTIREEQLIIAVRSILVA